MSGTPAQARRPKATVHRVGPFTTYELVVLALLAAMVATSKVLMHIPLHVPGHSGLLWIAMLIAARGLVARHGAATAVGFVAGIIVSMVSPSKEGPLTWMKYALPGVTIDLLVPLLGARLDRAVPAMLIAALAHTAKLATAVVIGAVLGIPREFLALGLGVAAATHVAFGAGGGLLGAVLVTRLSRSGLPAIRRLGPPSGGEPAVVPAVADDLAIEPSRRREPS